MMTVGAAHWQNVNSIESYSSRGPTPDGRIKPDLVGAACGQTAADSSGFCGTSQASPHVAGMAALVRQRFPSYTPEQVVSYLKETAQSRGLTVLIPTTPGDTASSCSQLSHSRSLALPTIDSTTPGADSLTVAWSAPSSGGGSTVTAYDLRHIETSADETVDANWTVAQDAWTGSGALSYELTGLTAGTQYDVQVRVVNSAGDGPWSATVTGTTTATVTPPGAPTGLTATANGQTQIDLSWTAPSSDGGSAITGYRIEVSEDSSSWSDLVGDTAFHCNQSTPHTGLTAGITCDTTGCPQSTSAGTGSASNVANATTDVAPAPDLVVDTLTVDTSAPAGGSVLHAGRHCAQPGQRPVGLDHPALLPVPGRYDPNRRH